MKKIKFPIIFISYILMLFSLTGCWSSHGAEENAVIDVLGIDKNEQGEIELTASIIKTYQLFSLTSKSKSEGTEENSLIISTSGRSIVEAISKLASTLPKRLYFGHMNVLVLGNNFVVEEDMRSSLDYFRRENDFRPNIQLFVTKGRARDIVRTKPQLKPTLGFELRGMYQSNRYVSTSMVKDLSKFSESLSNKSTQPYTGVLASTGISEQANSTSKQSSPIVPQENLEASLSLNETAVFKRGKLVGYLDKQETDGLLWLKGGLVKDVIIVPCDNGTSKGNTSLIIRKVNTTISPQKVDSKIALHVDIHSEGEISEMTCSEQSISSSYLAKLNRQVESKIRNDIDLMFKKIKNDWSTDLVGFGERINRRYPEDWKTMVSSWNLDGFKNAEIDVNINFSTTRYGLQKGNIQE